MVSSNRQTFACTLLLLAAASLTLAQKNQTGSISGKVTVKEKPVAGVVIAAFETNSMSNGQRRTRYRATTDADGNYRIDKVPAGSYYIFPLNPAYVVEQAQARPLLAVAAGETIRDIDFALVRGGVVTGKVTGDGQPLVEETVTVTAVDFRPDYHSTVNTFQTDDRGIYRVFGLRQGKYKVSVGRSTDQLPGEWHRIYKQTFYPSVTDPEKATILEVNEGSEIRNVDIEVESPVSTFKVSGRIIDGETGKPLANVPLGIERTEANFSVSSVGDIASNRDGEFKLHNVIPGHYNLFAAPPDQADWRSEPLGVEVVDRDITGLEIKTKRGASLSGVVVLQTYDEKAVAPKLDQLQIFVFIDNPSVRYNGQGGRVAPDGSFKIGGLGPGQVRLALSAGNGMSSNEFEVVSIEQNGVLLPKPMNLNDGEQSSGLRVVVRYNNFTGAISGQVKLEDGELPRDEQIMVSVRPLEENPSRLRFGSSGNSAQVDARGRFIVQRLEPGSYEVSVTVLAHGKTSYDAPKQQVNVTNNAVTDVTITVKANP